MFLMERTLDGHWSLMKGDKILNAWAFSLFNVLSQCNTPANAMIYNNMTEYISCRHDD